MTPRIACLSLLVLVAACGQTTSSALDGGVALDPDAGPDWVNVEDLPLQPPGTLNVGRQATLVVPSTYTREQAYPVVFALHAYATEPGNADVVWNLSGAAEEFGFLLVVPSGQTDDYGQVYWNGGPIDLLTLTGPPADDVSYLVDLVEELKTKAHVDSRRVIAIGASNGGSMSLRLLCEASDTFTGALNSIGTSFPTANMCPAATGRRPRIVMIKGTNDDHYLYGGGAQEGVAYPGAVEMADRFALRNGCSLNDVTTLAERDVDSLIDDVDTEGIEYAAGCPGSEVRLYSVIGGEHRASEWHEFIWEMISWLFRDA